MGPVTAILSTLYDNDRTAKKCFDGVTVVNWEKDLCHSAPEPAPWLALDYGKGAKVSVEKVVLFNRLDCCTERTRNVQIRLSNKLPVLGNTVFQGGELLGTFKGPARHRQKETEIKSVSGWEKKFGRYLIIQMKTDGDMLNLAEAIAFGSHTLATPVVDSQTLVTPVVDSQTLATPVVDYNE